jgi:septal ring factor EnvC (AmiA/AmiB activator)
MHHENGKGTNPERGGGIVTNACQQETDADARVYGTVARDTSTCAASPPDARISGHVLHTAIQQAERDVTELAQRIKGRSDSRDAFLRNLATIQAEMDELKNEHDRMTRHVRALHAART